MDAAATEAERAAIRNRRRQGEVGPWVRDDVYRHPDPASGKPSRIGDAVEIGADGELGCRRCGHALTGAGGGVVTHHAPLSDAGPWFALRWSGASPHFTIEETSCPSCGTLLDAHEVRRDGN